MQRHGMKPIRVIDVTIKPGLMSEKYNQLKTIMIEWHKLKIDLVYVFFHKIEDILTMEKLSLARNILGVKPQFSDKEYREWFENFSEEVFLNFKRIDGVDKEQIQVSLMPKNDSAEWDKPEMFEFLKFKLDVYYAFFSEIESGLTLEKINQVRELLGIRSIITDNEYENFSRLTSNNRKGQLKCQMKDQILIETKEHGMAILTVEKGNFPKNL